MADDATVKFAADITQLAHDISGFLADYSIVVDGRVVADRQVHLAALGLVTATLLATPAENWGQRFEDFVARLKHVAEIVVTEQQSGEADDE